MFETSKDLLFIAIGASIVVFTFFLCWALYYVVMMLKRVHEVMKEVTDVVASIKEKLDRLGGLLDAIEEKIKHSASYLPLLFKGMTELIDFFRKKKEEKIKKKKAATSL